MIEDIENRKKLFDSFVSIVEKRGKIEGVYAEKLSQLATFAIKSQNIKDNKPCSTFLDRLLNIIDQQARQSKQYLQKLEKDILPKFRSFCENDLLIKKLQNSSHSINKELELEKQTFRKIQTKYFKLCDDLIKIKSQCVASLSSTQISFEKKNKLFLKVDSIESQVSVVSNQYKLQCKKNNEFIQQNCNKLIQMVKKLQKFERDKIQIMRNGILNIQFIKSEIGLESRQKSVLSIEDFEKRYSDQEIKTAIAQQINQEIKKQIKKYFNPCQYINCLFYKITSKKIDEIINYGQSKDHKRIINQHINQTGIKVELQQNSPQIQGNTNISTDLIKIIEIFRNIFSSNQQLSQNLLSQFQNLIADKPFIRKDFILCFQKFRLMGKFQIDLKRLPIITQYLKIYLTQCQIECDTYNTKLLMVLSLSYYVIEKQNKKIYLQQYIKDHAIWSNIGWWECALLESIYQEIKIKSKKHAQKKSLQGKVTIWDIKGIGCSKQTDDQGQLTFVNIVFNQITYYVHNMGLFGLSQPTIIQFSKRFCLLFKLPNNMFKQTMNLIKGQSQLGSDSDDIIKNQNKPSTENNN